ncbi:MAG: UPF0182 family protein [Candidatus Nanopelagicales bacterium]|nr:UPF0182 family protein [Candidatus Nanopelagicales bacterium]MDZ4249881.1 UPF0182 family protein [Candidatus Nanopelagicales bacterium]
MSFEMPGSASGSGPGPYGRTDVAEPPGRSRALAPTLLVLGGLVLLFIVFVGIYSDWLWFDSVDKTSVFTTTLTTQIGLFVVFGAVMGAVIGINAAIAFRSRPTFARMTPEQVSLQRYRASLEPYRLILAAGGCAFLGLMTGLSAAAEWPTYQMWREGGDFGQTDPVFGVDIGFFVFQVPWLRFLLGFLFALLLLSLVTAVAVHYLYGGLRVQGSDRGISPAAQTHLGILAGVLLIVKAGSYWLDRFELATASQSLVQGSGFTGMKYVDANAILPGKTILMFASLIVAILLFIGATRRRWALPLIGLALLVLSSIVIGWLYPAIVQTFQVSPTEEVRERPYIQNNITATRTSYGLDGSEVQDYPGKLVAPDAVLKTDKGTLKNIRLLDPAIISPTFRQLQQIRGYYAFPDALNIDRYPLTSGTPQGAVVSVRELNQAGIPDGQRNWTNDKTVYTHGFGFVSAYDNTILKDGKPDFFERDVPPVGRLDIEQPRVYFGEMSPPYSIVGAPAGATPQELDYPDDSSPTGQRNNTYEGTGGAAMGGLFNRLVFATKFQDPNILLSDLVNEDSRVLWDRDPRDRVSKVAPWLTLDSHPYPVVQDGRITWIVDGYTTSNQYPNASRTTLSEATSDAVTTTSRSISAQARTQVTYMRNSVKATVDAYDGTVTLYQWDETDPVAQTWMRVFPGTVQPKSDIPPSVLEHIRYPEDIFKVQRAIVSRYHVTDPSTFYSGGDVWIIPFDPTKPGASAYQAPYFLTLQMPGAREPSFSLTTSFSPSRRETLAAFMAANSTPGPDYGKIQILQMPRNTVIPGPTQVQSNFEADTVISSQLTLLRAGGSDVVPGNLLSLPVAEGMLYVEPIYVAAAGGQGYPLLQKVLASYGQAVVMADTVDEALTRVFNVTGDTSKESDKSTAQQKLAQALEDASKAYASGQAALAKGDFAAYGKAQEALKNALDRAAKANAEIQGKKPSVEAPNPDASPAPGEAPSQPQDESAGEQPDNEQGA